MMTKLCLAYLLSVLITVSSNPLGQLVQPCNVCQPTSYSPTTIPVVIQQAGNTNPYPQAATVQAPAALPGPLGDTLNQIILNKILSNPSLQKIVDPNTKLYNQNGDEVKRQVPNTGVPNVINNYFIVPPEFFNHNETIVRNEDEIENVKIAHVDKAKRPRRRKSKRRIKKVEPSSAEDEEVTHRVVGTKRKEKKSDIKIKRKRVDSTELIDEPNELQETTAIRNQERGRNKRKPRLQKIITPTPMSTEESDEVNLQEVEDLSPVIENIKEKQVKRLKKPKAKNKVVDEESYELHEVPKPKSDKIDLEKELDNTSEMSQSKKKHRKESSNKKSDEKILKNIEIPTEIANGKTKENRKTRDSKRREAKKEEPKITNTPKKEPPPNITPFSDDVLKNFFPYMGNFYNPNTNYPYNFDQYYQYPDSVRNNDPNRNKRKRKNQNRKNNERNSNTHTIEIKLKPRNKVSTTEAPVTTATDPSNNVDEVIVSIEVEQSTESFERVTDIPMEMPHKVFPVTKDNIDSSSKESYETFSKLEDLHDFVTPELGTEDEVLPIANNGIINDYYPIFDVDVFYNPYAEKIKTLDDDRYFYETEMEDKINRDKRKYDRYEDSKVPKRETRGKEFESSDNKFDSDEYLDHDIVKSSDEIRRVKVPSKNTRVIPETVETVFAGSKVAKFGAPKDDTIKDTSIYHNNEEEAASGHTKYVVAKSLGRPEDYW